MSIPLRVQAARPLFTDIPDILTDVERVLSSGRLMLGPYLERFEAEFARSVGSRYAIGVNSCTTALEITLRHVGVEGAEVIVPTNTFVATANAVVFAGGRPVLTDVNPDTLCLDAATLRRALSSKTKAVILVHLAGIVSPDLPRIQSLCAERGIPLIEDCAHAHGATFEAAHAGTFGFAGCFSFYPTKLMTTGTGGMIATNDPGLNDYARSLRLHGRSLSPQAPPEAITNLGNDWFLDEVRAVLGLHQLRRLPEQLTARRALAHTYRSLLRELPMVKPLEPDPRCQPSYYKFVVLAEGPHAGPRLREALREKHGIEAESLYFPPCHLQPLYQRLFGYREGMFPVAEERLERQLCLPVHGGVSAEDAGYVVGCLAEELKQLAEPVVKGSTWSA